MKNRLNIQHTGYALITLIAFMIMSCASPNLGRKTENKTVPTAFINSNDTTNSANIKWHAFLKDPNLIALIDSALKNNQELNVMLQEIQASQNEVRAAKSAYRPTVDLAMEAGLDKVGRHTSQGASDDMSFITDKKETPEVLPNYLIGLDASWEIDVWKKLRNGKKAAVYKYLSSVEGKNFMVTNLVAEIANAYYELMALDNQLEILQKNIEIQQNALDIVKLEKEAAKVTELAVRKFEAELYKNKSRQFAIIQEIKETENKINFLVGRFPQKVNRNSSEFNEVKLDSIYAGVPSQLLQNRPDIREAEYALESTKMDVKAAKAEFYPSLRIQAGIGYNAFNPSYLLSTPQSLVYSLGGSLVTPLVNRNAIKARYYTANSKQVQAMYNYERSILNAYIEVQNQLNNMDNLQKSYEMKSLEVKALNESIDISFGLFTSARADYMEILLTQRDALESKFELIDTKVNQIKASINMYKTLGGGWN